jgi:PIN domain nuclease of toxin-antitoxin system
MRYLLDTHAFIWLDNDPEKLSPRVAAICANPESSLFLSMASIWEMQIKVQLDKLTLPASIELIVRQQVLDNRIRLLPIEFEHILQLNQLPFHHKDPFDRLLIAQARYVNLTLLSDDLVFQKYSVTRIW